MPMMTEGSVALQRLQAKHGWSLRDMAKRYGAHHETVRHWLTGEGLPGRKHAIALAIDVPMGAWDREVEG